MFIMKTILNSFIFWSAWIIIPFVMEIAPAVGSLFLLIKRQWKRKKNKDILKNYPEISLIVPVYNSENTLLACMQSIVDSTYPTDRIQVFLVNNQSKDNSFAVYTESQKKFPQLQVQWLNSEQGKSRALNLALYNCEGKYIINLDSDGVLEAHALENMVLEFEDNSDLNVMTGAILVEPRLVESYKGFFSRLLRKLEFMEYAQAFLAGRSYSSEMNAVYTLSGAFSAFRKSAVLKSRMYSTETVSEDTQITFQMRYLQKERVSACENAIFFVDPIENFDKLYTQRQRWQRGSLEVAQQFLDANDRSHRFLFDVNLRTLLYDHTFAFPRLIWYLALICLVGASITGTGVLYSMAMIFVMYIFIGYGYFAFALYGLRDVKDVHQYYKRQWWVVPLLPFFNLIVFFMRLAGIINSIGTNSSWQTLNLKQEKSAFKDVIKKDVSKVKHVKEKFSNVLNRSEENAGAEASHQSPDRLGKSWYFLTGVVVAVAAAICITIYWTTKTYGVGLNELLNTLLGGKLQGTSKDVIFAVIGGCVIPTVICMVLFGIYVKYDRKRSEKKGKNLIFTKALPVISASMLLISFVFANYKFDILAYYQQKKASSNIYEDYYVDPDSVGITADGKTKNLIYIYLESMETTYASLEDGGKQNENYIPNLTNLANENINFSNTEKLGGFHTVTGAEYTMAAIYTTTSGVPYALPVDSTAISEGNSFASGLTTLGDILAEKGYQQEFLCGSDATFGGRRLYFEQHGNYEIFDLYTAREKGYVPSDYFTWWGYEDYRLFDIAKDEVTRLASGDKPFNLTMLTVDLHHIGGYICPRCGHSHDTDTANVASCTDALVREFVDWCSEQPFYEDTVIVITGNHPRMDTYLVDGVDYYDRTVYNCWLNSAVTTENNKDREFTHMDIFPTTLSAMGYKIEGDKLGLGTNLFSEKKTLAEKRGFEWVNEEVSKTSDFYLNTFAPELTNAN